MALFWGLSGFPQAYTESLFHAPTCKTLRERERAMQTTCKQGERANLPALPHANKEREQTSLPFHMQTRKA